MNEAVTRSVSHSRLVSAHMFVLALLLLHDHLHDIECYVHLNLLLPHLSPLAYFL